MTIYSLIILLLIFISIYFFFKTKEHFTDDDSYEDSDENSYDSDEDSDEDSDYAYDEDSYDDSDNDSYDASDDASDYEINNELIPNPKYKGDIVTTMPVDKPRIGLSLQQAAKKEAELAAKKEAELAAKKEAELAAKKEAELAAKKAAELAAKKAAELAAKKEAELAAKKEAELAAKKAAELAAKKEAELAAKKEAELAAKKAAELAAKNAAEIEVNLNAFLSANSSGFLNPISVSDRNSKPKTIKYDDDINNELIPNPRYKGDIVTTMPVDKNGKGSKNPIHNDKKLAVEKLLANIENGPFKFLSVIIAPLLNNIFDFNNNNYEFNPQTFTDCPTGWLQVDNIPNSMKIAISLIPFLGDLFSLIGHGLCIKMGCGDNKMEYEGLCYDNCTDDYEAKGPTCWSKCSQNQKSVGNNCMPKCGPGQMCAQVVRPKKSYTRNNNGSAISIIARPRSSTLKNTFQSDIISVGNHIVKAAVMPRR